MNNVATWTAGENEYISVQQRGSSWHFRGPQIIDMDDMQRYMIHKACIIIAWDDRAEEVLRVPLFSELCPQAILDVPQVVT